LIIVAAGILIEDGKVLLTQRKRGTHLEDRWEFPGGKCEEDEDPKAALVRELAEEVGIDVRVGDPVCVTFHRYLDANKSVLLLFFEVTRTSEKEPSAIDVAAVRWATTSDLDPADFPPADVDVLAKVRTRLSLGRL
jgi:8-oxo-dGTP diphosphatase